VEFADKLTAYAGQTLYCQSYVISLIQR